MRLPYTRESSWVAFAQDFPKIIEEAIAKARPHQMKFLKRIGFKSWVDFAQIPKYEQLKYQKLWVESPELKQLQADENI